MTLSEHDSNKDARTKTVHMCISVRGMLKWDKRETLRNLKSILKSDGTRFASVDEFRNSLMDELVNGHEVLPLANPPCEGFDYKSGCPGHYVTEPSHAQSGSG